MAFDHRIAFPPTEVDFDKVGTTGQAHDNFPEPGQARYDWMRLVIIGLLSHQSSEDPPTQFRVGTIWYNTTKKAFFLFDGTSWVSLAEAISVMESSDGSILSLADWFTQAQDKLNNIQPRLAFSGSSVNDNVTEIPIPSSIQDTLEDIAEFVHPLVYINGELVDPRSTSFNAGCPTKILLVNDVNIDKNDRFTVIIESFEQIHPDDVVAS